MQVWDPSKETPEVDAEEEARQRRLKEERKRRDAQEAELKAQREARRKRRQVRKERLAAIERHKAERREQRPVWVDSTTSESDLSASDFRCVGWFWCCA